MPLPLQEAMVMLEVPEIVPPATSEAPCDQPPRQPSNPTDRETVPVARLLQQPANVHQGAHFHCFNIIHSDLNAIYDLETPRMRSVMILLPGNSSRISPCDKTEVPWIISVQAGSFLDQLRRK